MSRLLDPDVVQRHLQEVLAQMQQFNVTHPAPTFTELEDAVETALADLRQDLLEQSLHGQALADFRRSESGPSCSACGAPLVAIGQEERQVITQGAVSIRIERTRGRCSACGGEFFPPG